MSADADYVIMYCQDDDDPPCFGGIARDEEEADAKAAKIIKALDKHLMCKHDEGCDGCHNRLEAKRVRKKLCTCDLRKCTKKHEEDMPTKFHCEGFYVMKETKPGKKRKRIDEPRARGERRDYKDFCHDSLTSPIVKAWKSEFTKASFSAAEYREPEAWVAIMRAPFDENQAE